MFLLRKQFLALVLISYNNKILIITILWHIEILGIVGTSYLSIFRHNQRHLGIFSHVQPYCGTLRHIEAHSGINEAYGAIITLI